MKNLLFLFITCFLLFQGSDVIAQIKKGHIKNDLMHSDLKGKVKIFSEAKYGTNEDNSGKIKKGRITDTTFIEYDIRGNIIEYLHFLYTQDYDFGGFQQIFRNLL